MSLFAPRNSLPLMLALAMALSGCLTESDTYVAGIEGTGAPATSENTQGTVTAYGSVIVNGQRVEIGGAAIQVNDESATEDAIKLGMNVYIEAERDRRGSVNVLNVRYNRNLQGPVSEVIHVGSTHKELKVLGQTLIVHDDTHFAGIAFEELDKGVTLDVSGFVDAEGRVTATRVAQAATNAMGEVNADVQGLNASAATFQLGSLSVDYAQAVFVGVSADTLAEGQRVSVRGAKNGDSFVAERVTLRDQDAASMPDGTRVSLEGVVRGYQSAANFRLNGVSVNAEDASISGGELDQLANGIRVMVKGRIEGSELKAEELRLVLPGVERVVGTVEDINPATGEVVVMGLTYVATSLTAFEDRTPSPNRLIGMTEIRVGDQVELFARDLGEQVLATRIKRIDGDSGVVTLRGPVTEINQADNQIMVKNVWVNLGEDLGAEMIPNLSLGDMVTVEGTLTGSREISAEVLNILDVPGLSGCFPPGLGCAPPRELTSSRLEWDGMEPPTFRF
ncbi:DUF5666 domain-containing protein [Marinimicrobium sp. ABcell2]|uniref:DUF5666 domain-containing protein n=1 Tax=Marinimicrobium sp. ABcell2 TaxID=3069751 RepID=UPI0027B4FD00|nr:DUF5666 domain-containing protein [Marinimicrobium sp. ABcell2]MDQ2075747.1 DUF5666 domain-containing protein [Marinimicrobium sp. ABcell2]